MRKLQFILFAVLWLGGQFALLAHAVDLSAHTADAACEICLHSAPQDSGMLPSVAAIAARLAPDAPVSPPLESLHNAPLRAFAARGPPQTFSV